MQPPIEDYAVIGDGRSVALVSRAGSIDWLCWPRFDSPSLFGALIDEQRGGSWRITPAASMGHARVTRAYEPDSNVLTTRFETADGVATLTDLMPALHEREKHIRLVPDHELVRRVICERGEVAFEVDCDPRPRYGAREVGWRRRGRLGLQADVDGGLLTLRSPLDGPRGKLVLRAGESAHFSLSFTREGPAVLPPLGVFTDDVIARSIHFWRAWASRAQYQGPFRDAVVRSALVLKLLQYAPSGAIIAAPTTSLPEVMGGTLNWDYRYCWLRDASMTARVLLGLGYEDEGQAFVSWLLHATHTGLPQLRVLYDVYGRRPGPERVLPLDGYRGSRPVRVGNAAGDQLQIDIWGEVIDAATRLVRKGADLDRDKRELLLELGRFLCKHSLEPDEGIWEPRCGRNLHTHSQVLAWAGLDRLAELSARGQLGRHSADEYCGKRSQLREAIERRGWNERLQSYVGVLDSDELDASLLLLPYHRFEHAWSPRMRSTLRCIRAELGAGDALLRRYAVGDGRREGTFGICAFWAVECMALGAASLEEAAALFRRLLAHGNDVGLFAEEIDAETGTARGNFPQGFTHVGLISAALAL